MDPPMHAIFHYYASEEPPPSGDATAMHSTTVYAETPKELPLTDLRPTLDLPISPYSLLTHGFTAVRQPIALNHPPHSRESWDDPNLVEQVYKPETRDLILRLTGAKEVMALSPIFRKHTHVNDPTEKGFGTGPIFRVHSDTTPKGARAILRWSDEEVRAKAAAYGVLEAEDRAAEAIGLSSTGAVEKGEDGKVTLEEATWGGEGYKGPRWAFINVWRPLKRVRRNPLAIGDRTSFENSGYVDYHKFMDGIQGKADKYDRGSPLFRPPVDQGKEKVGAQAVRQHRWFWISDQDPDEALVFIFFDSDAEGERALGGAVPHSSFDIPGTEELEARESVELRCFAFW